MLVLRTPLFHSHASIEHVRSRTTLRELLLFLSDLLDANRYVGQRSKKEWQAAKVIEEVFATAETSD